MNSSQLQVIFVSCKFIFDTFDIIKLNFITYGKSFAKYSKIFFVQTDFLICLEIWRVRFIIIERKFILSILLCLINWPFFLQSQWFNAYLTINSFNATIGNYVHKGFLYLLLKIISEILRKKYFFFVRLWLLFSLRFWYLFL